MPASPFFLHPRLFVLAIACASTAQAGCSPAFAEAVARRLGYRNDAPHHVACKPLPSRPGTTVVALAYLTRPRPEDFDANSGDYALEVLLADSGSGAVRSRFSEPAAYASNAWRLLELQVDTARYDLAPGIRAFGVRARFGTGDGKQDAETLLDLFVTEGELNRRVLWRLPAARTVESWRGNCRLWEDTVNTIALGPSRAAGFRDLLVSSRRETQPYPAQAGACGEGDGAAPVARHALSYDGKIYAVPPALRRP